MTSEDREKEDEFKDIFQFHEFCLNEKQKEKEQTFDNAYALFLGEPGSGKSSLIQQFLGTGKNFNQILSYP